MQPASPLQVGDRGNYSEYDKEYDNVSYSITSVVFLLVSRIFHGTRDLL